MGQSGRPGSPFPCSRRRWPGHRSTRLWLAPSDSGSGRPSLEEGFNSRSRSVVGDSWWIGRPPEYQRRLVGLYAQNRQALNSHLLSVWQKLTELVGASRSHTQAHKGLKKISSLTASCGQQRQRMLSRAGESELVSKVTKVRGASMPMQKFPERSPSRKNKSGPILCVGWKVFVHCPARPPQAGGDLPLGT
jgi:hypothetical protein